MYDAEELQKPFEFNFGGLDQGDGRSVSSGHFNGVVQVVSKLFQLVQPTRVYFGEKDFSTAHNHSSHGDCSEFSS